MNAVKKLKLIPVCIAATMFVLGAVLSFISGIIGGHILVLMGVIVLAIGVARIVYGYLSFKTEHDARLNITLGVLDAIWGIIAIIFTGDTTIYVFLLGIWLLVGGVIEAATATKYVIDKTPTFWGLFIDSGINIVFGALMMIPGLWANFENVVLFTAVYLVLNAFTTILITLIAIRPKTTPAKIIAAESASAPSAKKVVVLETDEIASAPVKPVKRIEDEDDKPAAKKPVAAKKPATGAKTAAAKKPAASTAKKTTATAKKPAAKK